MDVQYIASRVLAFKAAISGQDLESCSHLYGQTFEIIRPVWTCERVCIMYTYSIYCFSLDVILFLISLEIHPNTMWVL